MMRNTILLCCGTLIFAAGMHTPAQAAPGDPQSPGKPPATGVVATVTATGCVERWTPTPTTATTTASSKGPSGVEYVLTHVDDVTTSDTAAGGERPQPTAPATRYLLLPDPSLKFGSHVNARVKIVGTIAPQPDEGASPQDQLSDPSSGETNLHQGPASASYLDNLVEVSKLTVVARSCGK